MRKRTKIWLITAASLVVIGLILAAAVMSACHWQFSGLSTVKYETNTYEINEKFGSIEINTDTADILFAVSEDDACRVVCYEQENVKHSVLVRDGRLTVRAEDNREWPERFGMDFSSPKITVYLPDTEYKSLVIAESTGDVEIPGAFAFDEADVSLSTGSVSFSASVRGTAGIQTSTGDIQVENMTADTLDLSVSTGRVTVSDLVCTNLLSNGATGDIDLKNVRAAKKISVERSTGTVVFDASDAAEIFVKTSTGDVTGSLLTEKIFVTETSTGDISVPETATGGRCEIKTSTGDIRITIG